MESIFDDQVEYLQPQMDEMIRAKARGIQFNWSVQVKYSQPSMKSIDYDDQENWFRCHDDDDDDDDEEYETPVYMHWWKLQIKYREQLGAKMSVARQRISESGNIQEKSNHVFRLEKCASTCSIRTNSCQQESRTDKMCGGENKHQLLMRVFPHYFDQIVSMNI